MNDFAGQLQHLFTVDGLISLLTLALLEIVLGIDNIIFISIIAGKLTDKKEQQRARRIGLLLALVMRVGLLFSIVWIMEMENDLFTLFGNGFSGRDIILFLGGVFLLAKTTSEIHEKMDEADDDEEEKKNKVVSTLFSIVLQIVLIDIVFSF